MANKIEFKVFGDAKELSKGLSSAKKQFDSLKRNAGLAFIGLTASIVGFTEAARKQQLAVNQLNQALQNTGNYSDRASRDLQKYAKSLQDVTLFGDETILTAQSLIASFGFEGETLKALTTATLDLAQAKGMDLVAAADLVSKAVGSSTNALSRYGVQVTGVAGSTARAESAVQNITKLFGGQAKVAAEGLGVNVQFKNTMGDLAETIGFALAPTVIKLTSAMKEFIETADQNPKLIKLGAGFLLIGTAIAGTLAAIGFLGSGIISAIGLFGSLGAAITPVLATVTSLTVALPALGIAGATALGLWIAKQEAVTKWFDDITRKFDLFGVRTREAQLQEADLANKLAVARKKAYDELNAEKNKSLQEEAAMQAEHEEKIRALQQETKDFIKNNESELKELSMTRTQEELEALKEKWAAERDGLVEHLDLKLQILSEAGINESNQVKEIEEKKAEIIERYNKLIQKSEKKTTDAKEKSLQDRVDSVADYSSQTIGILRQAGVQTKALEITNAVIQQGGAIMKAWNSAPFPANLPAVALTTAQTGLILSQISKASYATGTPNIPYDMDATVHKGETIIPKTFAEGIREGDLTLSGGGNRPGGLNLNFDGATFVGVTEDIVDQIFTKASEMTKNRTLVAGVA